MNLVSGNSISVGHSSTNHATKSAAALFYAAVGKSYTNVAVAGAMACNSNGLPYQAPAIYTNPMSSGDIGLMFLGTNEMRTYGDTPLRRAVFMDALRALIVHQAAAAVDSRDSSVTYTGTWADWGGNSGHVIGRASSQVGAKASFPITGPVVHLGMMRQNGATGSFSVKVDGVSKGTHSLNGTTTANPSWEFGPKGFTFRGLGAGSHTVEIEVVTGPVWFDFYAFAPKAHLLVAAIPMPNSFPSGGSVAGVNNDNTAISALCAELAGDGLSVHFVNTPLTSGDIDADYHPNDSGHQKIANALKAVHDVIFGITSPYIRSFFQITTLFASYEPNGSLTYWVNEDGTPKQISTL